MRWVWDQEVRVVGYACLGDGRGVKIRLGEVLKKFGGY